MTETVLQWGLDCIRLIQSRANPPLTWLMIIITTLGSTIVYLILLSWLYWCRDEKKSLRLGTTVLISVWINLALKFLLDQPRPFFEGYDPSLGIIAERLGGFPSGHAQISLVMWIIIASWGGKKWHYCAAAVFCFLVGFSRVYLGVHFPTDVLGGWLIGGVILCGYFLAAKRIEALLTTAPSPRAGLITCAALAFVMILYRPATDMLMPGGMLLGLGTGYFLNRRYIGFSASGGEPGSSDMMAAGSGLFGRVTNAGLLTLLRFALGTGGVFILNTALDRIVVIFHNSDNYLLVAFMRFVLLALWVSAGAPWLFRTLGLAKCNTKCNMCNTNGNIEND